MKGTPLVIEPRQERSRRTLDRLLDAAQQVLAESGAEGATVPRIAERAGMSVGVVDRRFRDKDALLRAVYERFFETTLEANRAALDPARWRRKSARSILASVVRGMVRGHAMHRALLRALIVFADTHADAEFRNRIVELNAAAAAQVLTLLQARRSQIAHPELERAVGFVLIVVASVLSRWVHPDSDRLLPYHDETALSDELVAMAARYLGVA